jgi:hypothetical protein
MRAAAGFVGSVGQADDRRTGAAAARDPTES